MGAGFATLARTYEAKQPISDGYVYRIAYAGRTVRIEEDAELPPRLERVHTLLAALVRQ